MFFWAVTLCELIGRYQRFREAQNRTVFDKLVSTYESTWCHNPEDHHHLHHYEKLKSYKRNSFFYL
jgi:hypothetical protein